MAVVHAKSPDTPAPGYVVLDALRMGLMLIMCTGKIPLTRHSMPCSTSNRDGFTQEQKMTWFDD
jgi:hypothetical protein